MGLLCSSCVLFGLLDVSLFCSFHHPIFTLETRILASTSHPPTLRSRPRVYHCSGYYKHNHHQPVSVQSRFVNMLSIQQHCLVIMGHISYYVRNRVEAIKPALLFALISSPCISIFSISPYLNYIPLAIVPSNPI